MRKYLILIHSLMLFLLSTGAQAHNEAHELGHHWEDSVYIGELRFQLVLMTAIACIIASISLIRMMLKNRSARK